MPAIVGVIFMAAGVFLGWWAGKKKGVNTPRYQTSVRLNHAPPTAGVRPINSEESETIRQIAEQLDKIEKNLNPNAPTVPPGFSLKDKLNGLLSRLKAVSAALPQTLAGDLRSESGFDVAPAPFAPATIRTFSEEFTDMYNTARDHRDARNEFWGKFKLSQLGNRNTSDQRMGRTNETDFRTSESVGDFIAAESPDTGYYLVVPSFNVTIDDTSFRFGGIEAAFSCDFTLGSTYQNFKVNTPAEFSRTGDTWIVKSKGELLLLRS